MMRSKGFRAKKLFALAFGLAVAVAGIGFGGSAASAAAVTSASVVDKDECPEVICGMNSNQVLL